MDHGEEILVVCSGQNNGNYQTNQEYGKLRCDAGDFYPSNQSGKDKFEGEDFQCNNVKNISVLFLVLQIKK